MALCAGMGVGEAAAAEPVAMPDGVRQVQPFALPVSPFLSAQAQADVRGSIARGDPMSKLDNATLARELPRIRAETEHWAKGVVAGLRERYGVQLSTATWNGVPVTLVQPPAATPAQRQRLLIELHGGAFVYGSAASFGMMEAIPVAAMTGVTVVSVDYRQGPEHKFPAASEDVARVYREALKHYAPEHIGVFGCSAGGVLTGESLAWFAKEKLPMPGAAGMFCAGGDARYGGDSRYVVAAVNDAPLPDAHGRLPIMEDLYYGEVDFHDPLVSPVFSDALLAQFPPLLFVTATRAAELSNVSYMHSRLVDLGRESDLHVWDGLGHAFHLNAALPESQQAYRVMARFFSRHLGLPAPAFARTQAAADPAP
ncbi:alpha/beta hydrolase [Xanthomonas sp. Kuri4-1]